METPDLFQTGYYSAPFTSEDRLSDAKNGDHFIIEDLLDFPNDDGVLAAEGSFEGAPTGMSTDSSAATAGDNSCNSSFSNLQGAAADGPGDGPFGSEFCVPYDDMAELEWLSNFVDESFSTNDLQKLHLIGTKPRTDDPPETHQYHFQTETTRTGPILPTDISVPAKARSKRPRAAPGNWTSRLLVVSPTPPASPTPAISSSLESDGKRPATPKKKELPENSGEGRRCVHCATDKTPQWRTGPMGPKTLCNACGVRYKSGRLVPEYRPAASPTFVQTKHSNSHRKVLELRKKNEVQQAQQHQQQFLHQSVMFDVSNGDDYLIHQHIGPDFRQLI